MSKKIKKVIKKTQEGKAVWLSEDAYNTLEFLSIKSRANKSEIVSSWLEQVAKVVYPLQYANQVNFMFAQNDKGDKVICYFAPMIFGELNGLSENATEILGEKLLDCAKDKLLRNAEQRKKKGEK